MAMKLANEIIDAANEMVIQLRKKKKPIEWQKQIKLLHILDIKFNYNILAKSQNN